MNALGHHRGKRSGHTSTMRSTQYLTECQIKFTQDALANRDTRSRVLIKSRACVYTRRTRVATCVPSGVPQRALLREQQQEYACVLANPL